MVSKTDAPVVLVLNCGSSSIKYSVFRFPDEKLLLHGEIDRIGQSDATQIINLISINDQWLRIEQSHLDCLHHQHAIELILETFARFESSIADIELIAISHRFVHGGEQFITPVLVTDQLITELEALTHLAPIHNPSNLLGIKACHQSYPETPQVVVFDTAFHHSMPDYAYRYAIPNAWYDNYQIRRYGFHGLSHQYVTSKAAELIQKPVENINVISLHLGNGASVCAIKQGQSIDTSMGFTPLEGLIMGSRCGDIDPAIPLYVQEKENLSADTLETQLNMASGLTALTGTNDVRHILKLAEQGNEQAKLAIDMYVYRIRHYIGAYAVSLGSVDAIIFTAGVGEHAPEIRQRCCENLTLLGVEIDQSANNEPRTFARAISTKTSQTAILVIPTNEELQIAHQTLNVLKL
jgi:acetate kinase